MIKSFPRNTCLFICLLSLSVLSLAQGLEVSTGTSSIIGRITIDGQPAIYAEVILKKESDRNNNAAITQAPHLIAVTNADGRYRIASVSSGRYRVIVYAPAYVIEGEPPLSYEYGKVVDIKDGESVENVDFQLTRGGVITGKITDEYGKPVVAEMVGVFRLDLRGKTDNPTPIEMMKWQTDDRGVYRVFGLEAGRYLVGAGASAEDMVQIAGHGGTYKRTYHPDAVDESRAKIIEVRPGSEVENVDIKLVRSAKSYTVTGRVVNSETGDPVSAMMIEYSVADNKAGGNFGAGSTVTNSNGEFRFSGLLPNSYTAYIVNLRQSDYLADQVDFTVVDSNVTGLEIKIIRGGSISGVAVVEGMDGPAVFEQLSKIQLRAEGNVSDMRLLMVGGNMGGINSDGTFRIGGVRAGKLRIVQIVSSGPKSFTLARIEHNGIEVEELSVAQGESLTGVRLIFTYGNCILAGNVEIKGGTLPPGTRVVVRALPEGVTDVRLAKQTNVDARGQFKIEGLSQGNYRIYLMIFMPQDSAANFIKVEQLVHITGVARQEITLVFDLKKGADK